MTAAAVACYARTQNATSLKSTFPETVPSVFIDSLKGGEKVNGEEEEVLRAPDVKNFVLTRLEALLFGAAMKLYDKRPEDCIELLDIAFCLLPPENRRELAEQQKFVADVRREMLLQKAEDPYKQMLFRMKVAAQYADKLKQIIASIQDSLYRKHLRTGYTGIDLRGEGGDYDVQLEPEEPEKNAD
jgi:hypothetical protein